MGSQLKMEGQMYEDLFKIFRVLFKNTQGSLIAALLDKSSSYWLFVGNKELYPHITPYNVFPSFLLTLNPKS